MSITDWVGANIIICKNQGYAELHLFKNITAIKWLLDIGHETTCVMWKTSMQPVIGVPCS